MLAMIPRNKKYGWIPDLPDQRDFSYAQLAAAVPIFPKAIDLRNYCSPVELQGELGCCTACALVGNLEFLKKKNIKKMINFSRLFLYYNERVIRNTTQVDSGSSLRDGIKTLVKLGDCTEIVWPYKIADFAVKPNSQAYLEALNYQIKSYWRITSLAEMKHTLSTGFPFVFGFAVYESFESTDVAKIGIVPMPAKGERVVGGHAVMAVGYDDVRKLFIIRNSWGSAWGDHGYFYLPYSYLTNHNLSSDFWTVREME
jgi:C1A family cysteine protease